MASFSIVEDLDVIEDIFLRNIKDFIETFSNTFFFQTGKKRLSNGVVPTISTATHVGLKIVLFAKTNPVSLLYCEP